MMNNMRRAATSAAPLRTLGVRHMSGKDVRFGNEARAKMLAGVDKLADAVQVRRRRSSRSASCRARTGSHGIPRCTRRLTALRVSFLLSRR